MKIFSAEQIQRADAFTIENEPISSIDLMERASGKVFQWLKKKYHKNTHFDVFCGPGNNGGDGLALARMLKERNFSVIVWVLEIGSKSEENQHNFHKLETLNISIQPVNESNKSQVKPTGVIVDAIFGSGLTRTVAGWVGHVINELNSCTNPKVSIDMASGLFAENNDANEGVIFQPDHTLSFEIEKLAFQFPENQKQVGRLKLLPIGLSSSFVLHEPSSYCITSKKTVKPLLKIANPVAYKNTFGHALLVVGSTGKMGAAVLCAKACLKSGAGLVTAHIPKNGNDILQISVPEVMTIPDNCSDHVTETFDISKYQSIGIGPGLGQDKDVFIVLKNVLDKAKKPLVIDADAINVISTHQELLKHIPHGSILTPHLGEWRRLVGEWKGSYHRLQLAKEFCKKHKVVLVLKGAKSAVVCPDGQVHFNSTGNSGMATAGSGDVLTGILTGLLAQGYESKPAAILGVYIHGLAGDLALKKGSRESVIASDIIDNIGEAYKKIGRYH